MHMHIHYDNLIYLLGCVWHLLHITIHTTAMTRTINAANTPVPETIAGRKLIMVPLVGIGNEVGFGVSVDGPTISTVN